jgi:hypothetical protein
MAAVDRGKSTVQMREMSMAMENVRIYLDVTYLSSLSILPYVSG